MQHRLAPNIPPPPPTQSKNNRNANGVELPDVFMLNLDDLNPKRPWTQPNHDPTDYFNYGFNEETWKLYTSKVRQVFQKEDIPKQGPGRHMVYDTERPVEAGGFGPAISNEVRGFDSFKLFLKISNSFL